MVLVYYVMMIVHTVMMLLSNVMMILHTVMMIVQNVMMILYNVMMILEYAMMKCKTFPIVSFNSRAMQLNKLAEKSKILDRASLMFYLKVHLKVHLYAPFQEEEMEDTFWKFNLRRIPSNFMNLENIRNV